MSNLDNIQTAIDAGKGLASKVEDVAGIPCLIHPGGATVLDAPLKLADQRADKPRRRTGTANLQSIGSFCEHVNRFKSASSVVWADASKRAFTGVLNYHPAGAASDPAWGDHCAVYPCPLSTEWSAWGKGAESRTTQDQFATFLIRRERDLAVGAGRSEEQPYPSPADLMTLAASLETFSNTKAKRERDVRTGRASVSFSEESGVKGNVTIPPAFGVRIPIFEDSAPVLVEVGLRVEVVDGAAQFVIGITDADKVLRAAFAGLVDAVKLACELPVFIGTPEQ